MSDHNILRDLVSFARDHVKRCEHCDAPATMQRAYYAGIGRGHYCDECVRDAQGHDLPGADRIRRLVKAGVLR